MTLRQGSRLFLRLDEHFGQVVFQLPLVLFALMPCLASAAATSMSPSFDAVVVGGGYGMKNRPRELRSGLAKRAARAAFSRWLSSSLRTHVRHVAGQSILVAACPALAVQ